jgi:hypothetical protein
LVHELFCIRCGNIRGARLAWCGSCLRALVRANRSPRRAAALVAIVLLTLGLTACDVDHYPDFLSHCDENGQRYVTMWNGPGPWQTGSHAEETLWVTNSNVIPEIDLPLALIADTDNAPGGETGGFDSVQIVDTSEEPLIVWVDIAWGSDLHTPRHIEATFDDCPPA